VGTTVLDHDGPFTERDFLELTPRHGHVELVEGTLLVGPMAGPEHGAAVAAVRAALEKSLPDGLRVVGALPLRLGHDCVLVPDLMVARAAPESSVPEPAAEPVGEPAEEPVAADEESDDSDADAPEEGGEESPAAPDAAPDLLDCADVLMVVDVVDRTHGITQRSFKPQLYARSRIPYAVLVDSAARVGSASMLIGGRHHEFAQAGAGERLLLEEPFRIEIDLDALAGEAAEADQ
jgi:hypothetical protein